MALVNITYPKALDENGNVIHISEVTQENRGDHTYWCIGCGKALTPVLCTKKASHFRHTEETICNPETYLHNLAKRELAKRFETQEKFEVSYFINNTCPRFEECRLRKQYAFQDCNGRILQTIDLKQYYDTCDIEGSFRGFIADVLLKNSSNPQAWPVFLEVLVTHPCSEEKIESNNRIIEIQIKNEDDINRPIVELTKEDIEASRKRITIGYPRKEDPTLPSTIKFYGFKRNTSRSDLKTVDKFVYLKDGQAGTVREYANCGEMEEKHFEDTLFEVIIPSDNSAKHKQFHDNLLGLGFALSIKKGFPLRHCYFCESYPYRRCRVPVPYKERDRFTGEMKDVSRLTYVNYVKPEEYDLEAHSKQCPDWKASELTYQREVDKYKDYGYLTWEPPVEEE